MRVELENSYVQLGYSFNLLKTTQLFKNFLRWKRNIKMVDLANSFEKAQKANKIFSLKKGTKRQTRIPILISYSSNKTWVTCYCEK
jgi:hypothetical protein